MRRFSLLCLVFICLVTAAQADKALLQRKDVQRFMASMVKEHGFKYAELNRVFNDVKLQPQIIESMDKPYEKKPWDIYKQLFLTGERVEKGLDFWKTNEKALQQAEKQFGVPANIIVAIIGVETLYGKKQGNYRVIDALATLAFNYPKRSPYFTKELTQYLLLCKEHQVSPSQYYGSYAGAMGKPQFMPSSYRYYAVNFNGSLKKDLMNDDGAVIASVANYFRQHGWQTNQGIVLPATIAGNRFKTINTNYKKAAYRWQQLQAAGIKSKNFAPKANKMGLIELTPQMGGAEYWLTYPNFYVITRYNSSPQYAMVVYLLSQQLKTEWIAMHAGKRQAFA